MGVIMTTLFVKESGGRTLEEVDAGCVTLRAHDEKVAAESKRIAESKRVENKSRTFAADSPASTVSQEGDDSAFKASAVPTLAAVSTQE